jgi:hypothetical protein
MRNIQLIDGVDSATFSISLAPDEAFGAIFPNGQDMELAEKVFTHVRTERTIAILSPVWDRRFLNLNRRTPGVRYFKMEAQEAAHAWTKTDRRVGRNNYRAHPYSGTL